MSKHKLLATGEASILHLLHRAGQAADELFATTNTQGRLTPRQYEVLKTVAAASEPSQTQLVGLTGIDRSTLADIVRRLVERGLLVRTRTKTDARRYAVSLTQDGQEALDETLPAVASTNERLLAAVPEKEREDFVNHLTALIEAVESPNLDVVKTRT